MGAMATDFRNFLNINGYEYDANKTDTIYAEDLNSITAAVNNLEDEIDGVPAQISAAVAAAVAATKDALYPVGSIYMNYSSSTNPATLLGFGSWSQVSRGTVLVGQAASGTFATAGSTGGEENHTLTIAEMPSHKHAIRRDNTGGDAGYLPAGAAPSSIMSNVGSNNANMRGTFNDRGGTDYSNGGALMQTTGGGGAHNNLQPYLVVYMWRRTE